MPPPPLPLPSPSRRPLPRRRRPRPEEGRAMTASATPCLTAAAAPLKAAKREFAKALLLAGALTVFISLLGLVIPTFDLQLYDRVAMSHSYESLIGLTCWCVAGMTAYCI